jgi:acyl phosphate:glycerol-3-phosphate acyltransferase
MIASRLISLLIGYAFGNVTFGFLIGKIKHIDIRKKGSGNIGTTNTLRILGPAAGAFTLLFDCLKAVIAAYLAMAIMRAAGIPGEFLNAVKAWAAFGAVIGHIFPVLLHFKGGKGVATGLGFLIAVCPLSLFASLGSFILIVIITQYVSAGSIVAAVSLPTQAIIFRIIGVEPYKGRYGTEIMILTSLVGILALIRHHANINRLIHHCENKLSFKKKKEE